MSSSAPPAADPAQAFLQPLIGRKQPYSHRPWVTLTYAQSLDGMLAGPKGQQIQLSGQESKAMTHRCARSSLMRRQRSRRS